VIKFKVIITRLILIPRLVVKVLSAIARVHPVDVMFAVTKTHT